MNVVNVTQKCFTYGLRHVLQTVDYRLGRDLAPPERVGFTLTHRCNCQCVMCDLWKLQDAAEELPAEKWIGILEELHSWIGTFRAQRRRNLPQAWGV